MNRIGKILSLVVPITILVLFALGFLFEPNSPTKTNILNKYAPASEEYPFGTDALGRCVFSRVLEGGKTTLGIVLLGSSIVLVLGITLGMLFARTKRKSNILSDSILNSVTAIPPITYLIILVGIWGNSIPTMIVALTASLILRMIKLVKTLIETEYSKAYVNCAVSCGASQIRIMTVHILPFVMKDIIQFLCLSCSDMVLAISGFSFIGFTLGNEVVDWGVMLSEARRTASLYPSLLLYPIAFIFITSLCFNYIGRRLQRRNG